MSEEEEIEMLLALAAGGNLEKNQAERLLQLMKADATLLPRLGSLMATERLLCMAHSRNMGEHFSSDIVRRISFQQGEMSRDTFVTAVSKKLRKNRFPPASLCGDVGCGSDCFDLRFFSSRQTRLLRNWPHPLWREYSIVRQRLDKRWMNAICRWGRGF